MCVVTVKTFESPDSDICETRSRSFDIGHESFEVFDNLVEYQGVKRSICFDDEHAAVA